MNARNDIKFPDRLGFCGALTPQGAASFLSGKQEGQKGAKETKKEVLGYFCSFFFPEISTVASSLFLFFLLLNPLPVAAQKRIPGYGPIVGAYLTGLAEELNELEFQLKHQEIRRFDYEHSKQRLLLMRRYVELLAAQSSEDKLPELQILADEELGTMGLKAKRNPDGLAAGDIIDNEWKILGIERGRIRFFVFQKLPQAEVSGLNDRKSARKIDPQEVIETIVIPEGKKAKEDKP